MSDQLAHLQATLADRYAIERELGRGGMATVYLARDLKYDRQVAVKVLIPDLGFALGPERFRREIQLVSQLNHPHILPIWDSGEADGQLYYVMPFVRGESLRARLDRERQLALQEALQITCEVAGALDYAHRQGIVHRDIKPENILLEDGHALVADFGVARAVSAMGEQRLTQTGVTLGTPTYMSPEQAMAERDLDGRSDVYSLGCVLYEMLAGSPPFTGPTAQAVIARHTLDEVPSITIVRGTIPEDVEDAVLRALAKVPADRYRSAGEFAEAIKACQTSGGISLGRAERRGRPRRRGRAKARDRRPLVAAAALAALTLGGAGWAGWSVWGRTHHTGVAGRVTDTGFAAQRIAVLYFADASPDKRLGYLADGLTESLIDQLQQVRGLDVVSRSGVSPFRGKDAPRDSVAQVLKAGTIVEGTVEPDGNRVRADLRLIDGNSGAVYTRASVAAAAADPLALRDTLAAEAARLLRQRVGQEVQLQQLRAGTSNPQAWSLVQQAEKARKDAAVAAGAADTATARRQFALADSLLAAAAALDRTWSKPAALRAAVALRESRLFPKPDDANRSLRAALTQVDTALGRNPKDADALELRGTIQLTRMERGLVPDQRERERLLADVERDLREAVRINPSQAGAWNALSVVDIRNAKIAQANLDAQKAYEADAYLAQAPEILFRLFGTSYNLEQFAEAKQWCDEGGHRFPDDPRFAHCRISIMGTRYTDNPDVAEAWRLLGEIDKHTPKSELEYEHRKNMIFVAGAIARAGLKDSARHVLERARADATIDPRGELLPIEAFVRTQLGDNSEAIDLLQRYLTAHPDHRAGFARANSWWWRDLRTNPRFQEIIAIAH